MKLDFEVNSEYGKKDIYHILKGPLKLSGRLIKKLKRIDGILLNGKPARTIDQVKTGDIVTAIIGFDEKCDIEPEYKPISIIFEDKAFLAVNKEPGTPVHPCANHRTGTLAQYILGYYDKNGINTIVRPINRLDRDTSGIVLFAKNSWIQDRMNDQMKRNLIHRAYLGIVNGTIKPLSGTINLPIARKMESVMERVVDPSGAHCVTHYKTLAIYENLSLVEFILETGRTHQIRVHAKAVGSPLLGDWLYSDTETELIDRQALHSYRLSFIHPLNNQRINLTAPLPADMKKVLAAFKTNTRSNPFLT